MKFYKNNNNNYNYFDKIIINKLTAILEFASPLFSKHTYVYVCFYKNGKLHNTKNSAYNTFGYKTFWLENNCYNEYCTFNKLSWRKFTKLQAFL